MTARYYAVRRTFYLSLRLLRHVQPFPLLIWNSRLHRRARHLAACGRSRSSLSAQKRNRKQGNREEWKRASAPRAACGQSNKRSTGVVVPGLDVVYMSFRVSCAPHALASGRKMHARRGEGNDKDLPKPSLSFCLLSPRNRGKTARKGRLNEKGEPPREGVRK